MTKADKKDEVMKEQLETEALMDAEVEAATDCGPVSHKVEKKEKEKAEQFSFRQINRIERFENSR